MVRTEFGAEKEFTSLAAALSAAKIMDWDRKAVRALAAKTKRQEPQAERAYSQVR